MKVSIAVERLQYGYVTVDVDSLDEAKEIQDFNGYDVTSQTTEDWHVPDTLLNKDGWYEVEEGEEAKLKPCPFCGGKAITNAFFDFDDLEYMAFEVNDSESIDGEVTCENERCINGWYLSPEDWNNRPIEDDLRKRIAELEAVIEILEDQQREAKNILIDKNLHIDSLYDEGYKLQQRIAEFEALVDELKPYRDGYDPEEAFPPEGEWVWLRDCDDNIEIMGYSQKEKCYWNYEGYWMPDDDDIRRWYPIGKLPEVQE